MNWTQQIEYAQEELRRDMDAAERQKLLRLLDAQNTLLVESKLMSFTAGFKLAWGIARELEADGLYSFEARGRRTYKRGEHDMAKKRANGEGNIRKRADGRWEGRYTAGYHPETGKRIIKNVLGKTQAECKAKLSAAMEAARGY